MNAYSKFPRRAFVIFVVLACGGWSSDNRANYENVNYIDDLFTHKVDGEGNINAVQSGRRGKLILAERQSDKPKKMRKGTSNAPRLNKNRRQAGGMRRSARIVVNYAAFKNVYAMVTSPPVKISHARQGRFRKPTRINAWIKRRAGC